MESSAADRTGPRRKTGRPLSFDREAALEQAMLAFWRHGYETTSIVDLTTAMGITAPSLYTSFGDKRQLFLEAARRYAGDPAVMAERIARASTAYDAAKDMLLSAAVAFTGEATPRGCLLASATASGSSGAADVQRAVAAIRSAIGEALRARIERDIAAGALRPATDAATLSGMILAVIQGMSVLARDGASRDELVAIGTTALEAFAGREAEAR